MSWKMMMVGDGLIHWGVSDVSWDVGNPSIFFFNIDYWYSSIASLYGMFVDFCIEVEIIEREARRHVWHLPSKREKSSLLGSDLIGLRTVSSHLAGTSCHVCFRGHWFRARIVVAASKRKVREPQKRGKRRSGAWSRSCTAWRKSL